MKLLLFSDLDGTFMNHDDYSFESLKNLVSKLKKKHSIIFNTSKTFKEVININRLLNLNFPFIVENGACIFFPKNYNFDFTNKKFFFSYKNYYGYPMTNKMELFKKIIAIRIKNNFKFLFYNEISDKKLKEITNLNSDRIKESKQRLFNEPIFWRDTNTNFDKFQKIIKSIGGEINIGGRFIHITDGYNKGNAVKKFIDLLDIKKSKGYLSVSLGDSHNDLSMLEITDYSCIIKTKKKKKLDLKKKKKLYHSKCLAPEGWSESINYIINKEKIYF